MNKSAVLAAVFAASALTATANPEQETTPLTIAVNYVSGVFDTSTVAVPALIEYELEIETRQFEKPVVDVSKLLSKKIEQKMAQELGNADR